MTAGLAGSGIAGLDDVLEGGFVRGRLYLVEGNPGTGKTTLALHFLMAGVRAAESCVLISLTESEPELRDAALGHGWVLDGIDLVALMSADSPIDDSSRQTLLHTSDLELDEVSARLLGQIARLQPRRVVIDSLSELRLIAQTPLRYRRQLQALRHGCARSGAALLLVEDMPGLPGDWTAHSFAEAVLRLEDLPRDYGVSRRRLAVTKYRSRPYREGFHDFVIKAGGISLYPRLVADIAYAPRHGPAWSTGVVRLDALLGGGLVPGTSTMLLGPSGAGKTQLAMQMVQAALERGERAAVFVFDEEVGLLRARVRGIGIDLAAHELSGRLLLQQVNPAQLSPGALAHRARDLVAAGVRVVVIDSITGYRAAMPGEQFLILHLHELLIYLNQSDCVTLVTVVQHGMLGEAGASVDLSYLSDTIIQLRFFEAAGEVRRAISVMKMRAGAHETSIREMRFSASGLSVGEPLRDFQGVLTGVPTFVGELGALRAGHP